MCITQPINKMEKIKVFWSLKIKGTSGIISIKTVSPFNKQSMYNIDDLSNNHLIPIETIFKQKIYLSIDQATDILHGKHIAMNEDAQLNSTQPIALFSEQNKFIGIGTFKTGFIYPKRLLSKPTD